MQKCVDRYNIYVLQLYTERRLDMNFDEYNEVINGDDTYQTIAKELKDNKAVIIGWTDGEATHYDIMFKLGAEKPLFNNYLQRGIRSYYLFVGIIDHTFYGFTPENTMHWSYIAEKLRMGDNETTRKIAELINGVIEELNRKE